MTGAHPWRWAMLAGVWLVYFCFGLTTAAMAPLVGPIRTELGLSYAAMGAVLGAWPLVYIASAVPCGAVLDRVGLRWSLAAGAAVIGLSGLLRAASVDHLTLWLAVAAFGLGGPLVSVGAPKLISLWFAGPERGLAMGVYVTGPALGHIAALSLTNSVVMPLLGGRWRHVLAAYALFVLGAGVAWLAVSAHPVSRALERQLAGEPRTPVLAVFAGLLRARPVRLLLGMSVGIFFFNHGLNNWLPEMLRVGGMEATAAGFWASVPPLVGILAALAVPRLAVPARRAAILAALFAAAGVATLLIASPPGPVLALGLVLQGVARGSMTSVTMLLLIDTRDVGGRHVGAAGGLFFSAAEVGAVLGPLTVGALYDLTGGFSAGLRVLTGVCAALVLGVWGFRRATRLREAIGVASTHSVRGIPTVECPDAPDPASRRRQRS